MIVIVSNFVIISGLWHRPNIKLLLLKYSYFVACETILVLRVRTQNCFYSVIIIYSKIYLNGILREHVILTIGLVNLQSLLLACGLTFVFTYLLSTKLSLFASNYNEICDTAYALNCMIAQDMVMCLYMYT